MRRIGELLELSDNEGYDGSDAGDDSADNISFGHGSLYRSDTTGPLVERVDGSLSPPVSDGKFKKKYRNSVIKAVK